MNALLKKLGGDQFDNYEYWSSAELSDSEGNAWDVGFNGASINGYGKIFYFHVRAVCAF